MTAKLHSGVLAGMALLLGSALASAGLTLSPVRSIELPDDLTAKPIPKWENGYIVRYEIEPVAAVVAYDRNGRRLFRTPLSFPEAERVLPSGVAASRDGRFAVHGSAFHADGLVVPFVAWLDAAGRITRVLRWTDYAPFQLCFAPDGTLWMAGWALRRPGEETLPDHDILRAYAPNGELKVTALPFSSFATSARRHPAKESRLVANDKTLLFYSRTAGEWVTLSFDGEILSRSPVPPPRPDIDILTGFVLAPDSSVYLSAQMRLDGRKRGSSVLRWDKATGAWREILYDNTGVVAVFGAEGDQLIVSRRLPQFDWVRID